jgi:hypothetical protein
MADILVDQGEVGAYEIALTANTEQRVIFTNRDLSEVEVANLGGTSTVYVALSASGYPKSATVAGKSCYAVYPNSVVTLPVRVDGATLVSLICATSTTASVASTG